MNPRVITHGTREYKNLEAVAKMLEALSPNEATYEVEDVYFDFGQNWMWTTILRRGYMDCQVLNPREWGEIIMANNLDELTYAINDIINGKYFMDKQKSEPIYKKVLTKQSKTIII